MQGKWRRAFVNGNYNAIRESRSIWLDTNIFKSQSLLNFMEGFDPDHCFVGTANILV
jgi:hypothetical protein